MKYAKNFYLFYYDIVNGNGEEMRRWYYAGTYSMPHRSKRWHELRHKLNTDEAIRIGYESYDETAVPKKFEWPKL